MLRVIRFAMVEPWTLARIAAATNLPTGALRYVLDHGLVPWLRPGLGSWQHGRGAARTFTTLEAFALTLADRMLRGGVRRATVEYSMEALCAKGSGTDNSSLCMALLDSRADAVEIADPGNVRLIGRHLGSHWYQAGTGAKLTGFFPVVTIRIDVADLRRSLTNN